MSERVTAVDIERAYEAVRAQATGMVPQVAPRGLALILDVGLPAWMASCSEVAHAVVATVPRALPTSALEAGSAELVSVLAAMAMAMASHHRCPT